MNSISIAITIFIIISYGFFLFKITKQKKRYVGEILITESNGITLYSLELNDDPEKIKLEKEVTFKVVIPEEESDRE